MVYQTQLWFPASFNCRIRLGKVSHNYGTQNTMVYHEIGKHLLEHSRFPRNIDIPWNMVEYCGILRSIVEYLYSVNIPGFPPIFRGIPRYPTNILWNINIPWNIRILYLLLFNALKLKGESHDHVLTSTNSSPELVNMLVYILINLPMAV